MLPYSGKEVPLVPGSLRVYRTWGIPKDGFFRAVNWPVNWSPGWNTATCQRPLMVHLSDPAWDRVPLSGHPAPHSRCTCGFYGNYRPEMMPFTGVAEFSGRVILGTNGARAEKARIVAHAMPPYMYELKEMYPEVQWFTDMNRMLEAFPPQDVSELIGAPEPEEPEYIEVTDYSGKRLRYLL